MIPRGVLDIDWPALLFAARCTRISSTRADELSHVIDQLSDDGRAGLVCLSVRSGLDLVLSALNWPRGSEILMSAVTIPEMAAIVQAHGLVPVPVDVSASTLAPDIAQLHSRITPRTRALLVAHLFGSRLQLGELARVAREHGLALWEDLAQGYAADGHFGDAQADISFLSFGVIKAQTALGGAIVRFRDPDLAAKCTQIQEQWPQHAADEFQKRINKAMVLRTVTYQPVFTVVSDVADWAAVDLDARLNSSARAFRPADLTHQLRQRPCVAMLELLHRRLLQPDRQWILRKTRLAEQYRRLLPREVLIGADAEFPSHWVLPIRSRDPMGLRARLWRQGFDATVRASQLYAIGPPATHMDWTTPCASAWVSQLIYMPLHPALRACQVERIARIVRQAECSDASHGQIKS